MAAADYPRDTNDRLSNTNANTNRIESENHNAQIHGGAHTFSSRIVYSSTGSGQPQGTAQTWSTFYEIPPGQTHFAPTESTTQRFEFTPGQGFVPVQDSVGGGDGRGHIGEGQERDHQVISSEGQ